MWIVSIRCIVTLCSQILCPWSLVWILKALWTLSFFSKMCIISLYLLVLVCEYIWQNTHLFFLYLLCLVILPLSFFFLLFSSSQMQLLFYITFTVLCSLSLLSSVLSIQCNKTQYFWPLEQPHLCCDRCPPGTVTSFHLNGFHFSVLMQTSHRLL